MVGLGRTVWVVPEGYIPSRSHGPEPAMESHDSLSILNVSEKEARIEIMIYFTDRDPVGPYIESVPAERSKHIRLNSLVNPESIPRDTEYSSVLSSSSPVVVQYTRLDSRQAKNALLSTMAYPAEV